MAIQCGRCGAVNPDGNQFCQTCGTPLGMAAPPPGPPVAYASPPPLPMGYQSPYYTPNPTAPQPPVHRTPWVLIVSGVVVLIILMAGCGTALAILGKGNAPVSGVNSGLPSPSPAGSPSPIASPTAGASGSPVSNDNETVPYPQGWVATKEPDGETILLTNANGDGAVIVASGSMNPRQSAQQDKDSYQAFLQGQYPDTKDCPGSQTTTGTLAGASGIFWTLCFTGGKGANRFPAAAAMFMGANSQGSVYYLVVRETYKDNLSAFIAQAAPIAQGIQWKLK